MIYLNDNRKQYSCNENYGTKQKSETE